MKWEELLRAIGGRGWFDLPTMVQLSGEPRAAICTQLHRWCKAGKLIPLRRGMYAIAEEYRPGGVHPAELANQIYTPSYLSLHWALGYYGLIPEKVVRYTSVTPRQTKRFENAFGTFDYRHLKQAAFFGYRRIILNGRGIFIAEPEKAILDLWWLETGEWDRDRMNEMRFQNFELVDSAKLVRQAGCLASPRLEAAIQVWMEVAEVETAGTIEI